MNYALFALFSINLLHISIAFYELISYNYFIIQLKGHNVAKTKAKPKVEATNEPKNKGGRPTDYSLELAESFCKALTGFNSVQACCDSSDEFPKSDSTIFQWIAEHGEFTALYKKSNKIRALRFAEECIVIADDDSKDMYKNNITGELKPNSAAVTRSALRMNTRYGLIKKLYPEMFGDKIEAPKDPDETPKSLDEINNKINALLLNALTKNEQ